MLEPCGDGGTAYCPNDLAHVCRLNTMLAALDGPCTVDADCELAEPVTSTENCFSYGVCPGERPSILVTRRDEWSARAAAEMRAWCSTHTCVASASCPADDSVARCVAGRCGRGPP